VQRAGSSGLSGARDARGILPLRGGEFPGRYVADKGDYYDIADGLPQNQH